MPDSPFDFAASTIRIGDGPEIPVIGGTVTWNRTGHERATYALGAPILDVEGTLEAPLTPDMIALFDAAARRTPIVLSDQDRARLQVAFNEAGRQLREHMQDFLRTLATAMRPTIEVLAAIHRRFEAEGIYELDPGDISLLGDDEDVQEAISRGVMMAEQFREACGANAVPPGYNGIIGTLEGVYRPSTRTVGDDEFDGLDWGAPLEASDWNTPRPAAMICAHVCGPDPDHECAARATTVLEHANLAGGITRMPMCGGCHASEAAALSTVPDGPSAVESAHD